MKNDVKYRICNSVNCFYSNEHLRLDDLPRENKSVECRLCAYDYNHLCKKRNFLMNEIRNFKIFSARRIKRMASEITIKAFAIMAAIVIAIYFFNYFKILAK